MPAYIDHRSLGRPRDRAYALAAVVCVQLALGFALLTGLGVPLSRPVDVVQHLVVSTLSSTSTSAKAANAGAKAGEG